MAHFMIQLNLQLAWPYLYLLILSDEHFCMASNHGMSEFFLRLKVVKYGIVWLWFRSISLKSHVARVSLSITRLDACRTGQQMSVTQLLVPESKKLWSLTNTAHPSDTPEHIWYRQFTSMRWELRHSLHVSPEKLTLSAWRSLILQEVSGNLKLLKIQELQLRLR